MLWQGSTRATHFFKLLGAFYILLFFCFFGSFWLVCRMGGGEYCGKEVLEQHISLNLLVLSILFLCVSFWTFLVSVKSGRR